MRDETDSSNIIERPAASRHHVIYQVDSSKQPATAGTPISHLFSSEGLGEPQEDTVCTSEVAKDKFGDPDLEHFQERLHTFSIPSQ